MRPRPKFYWSPHQCADSVARTRKRPRRCCPPTDCAGPSRSPTAIIWFNVVQFELLRLRLRCHEYMASIMADLHCQTRIQIPSRNIRIPNLIATLYCTETIPIAGTWILIVTVPSFGSLYRGTPSWTDRHDWKHYLHHTVGGGNKTSAFQYRFYCSWLTKCYGSFTLPDSDMDTDSDSESKANGYIVVCRTFHIAQTWTQIPSLISV